jgi:hypothetical protein
MTSVPMTSLPMTSLPETTPHEEECPVCLEHPTQVMKLAHSGGGFKTINGCGHKLCWGCVSSTIITPGQYMTNAAIGNKRFIKCPMCRSFDKPSYEDLEKERDYYRDRATDNVQPVQHRMAPPPIANPRPVIVAGASLRQRCRNANCETPSSTQRKCPRHRMTFCCRRCYCCDVCQEERRRDEIENPIVFALAFR